jgi:hypothetical protein
MPMVVHRMTTAHSLDSKEQSGLLASWLPDVFSLHIHLDMFLLP